MAPVRARCPGCGGAVKFGLFGAVEGDQTEHGSSAVLVYFVSVGLWRM